MDWVPKLPENAGPRYLEVARAIEEAIDRGEIQAGTRLPSQRLLARHLGVTVGTISRAYAVATKRGLIEGEVGRGSYVRTERPGSQAFNFFTRTGARAVDLTCYRAPTEGGQDTLDHAFAELSRSPSLVSLYRYGPPAGYPSHRIAGTKWIARTGWAPSTGQIIVTGGAQQALVTALSAFTRPGDLVLTESLTYSGLRALAYSLLLELEGLPMDDQGLLPEALEAACAAGRGKVLYLQPTIHNPTGAAMPDERRRRIAEIAREHGLLVIEDDAAASGVVERPVPIAAHLPEQVCYLTSLSKSVAPALRIGYMACPEHYVERITTAYHALALSVTPLAGELATHLITTGVADEIARRHLAELETRHRLAAELLQRHSFKAHPSAFHLWLELPPPWRPDDFIVSASVQGVHVVSAEHFVAGLATTPRAVRVSMTPTTGARNELRQGLTTLSTLLQERPRLEQTVI